MNIRTELAQLKKEIDHELDLYLSEEIRKVRAEDILAAQMLVYFKKILLAGGKRIRPILMVHGYLAAGGKKHKEIVRAAMSVELTHAFLLMHDDIIDRDDLRHGKKTMHARYRDYARITYGKHDSDHFGLATGLVMGDFVFALANNALFQSRFQPEHIVDALRQLQNVVSATCVGEMRDVIMGFKGKASEKEILTMYTNKTARYTFEGPLHLGVILAGGNKKMCEQFSAFAVPLGIAFQLRDDVMGIFGSEKKIGKPVGSDIAEGKITLLVVRALKMGNGAQKKEITQLLHKGTVHQRDVARFRTLMVETGAKESIEQEMVMHIAQAQEALGVLDVPQQTHDFLTALTAYIKDREK